MNKSINKIHSLPPLKGEAELKAAMRDGDGREADYKHDFDVIYADPPWDVNQRGKYGAINHYDLMTLDEIKAMPVGDFCKENAICFLWIVGGPAGRKAGEEVLKAWGFNYVDELIGIKLYMGLGQRTRHAYEVCLVGEKGKMPVDSHAQINWLFFPKQEHSKKPEEMYAIIERLYQNRDYLELFARKRPSNKDWYIWGLEAEFGSDVMIPGYPVPEYSERVKFIESVPEVKSAKDNVLKEAA